MSEVIDFKQRLERIGCKLRYVNEAEIEAALATKHAMASTDAALRLALISMRLLQHVRMAVELIEEGRIEDAKQVLRTAQIPPSFPPL